MLIIEYHPNLLSDENWLPNWHIETETSDTGDACYRAYPSGTQTKELAMTVSPKLSCYTSLHHNKGSSLLLLQNLDDSKSTHFLLPGGELHLDGFKAFFTGNLPAQKEIHSAPHSAQTVTTQAMILAAGFATRLEPIAGDYTNYCKPALPLNQNESVILAMAKHLISFGITRLIVNTSFLPHSVKQALSKLPEQVELFYIDEDMPSGTAGGLFKAFKADFIKPNEPILIVQGDAVSNFDLGYLLNTHIQYQSLITIGAQTVATEDVHKFGIIKTQPFSPESTNPTGIIQQFKEKPSLLEAGDCRFANTGFYVLSPNIFETFKAIGQNSLSHGLYDFAKDFFPKILATCQLNPEHPPMIACRLEGYWTDIGNPLQYYQTLRETCPIQAKLPAGVIQLN